MTHPKMDASFFWITSCEEGSSCHDGKAADCMQRCSNAACFRKLITRLAFVTTDENGAAVLENLVPGNYLLKETAKDGYAAPSEPWRITVSYDGKITMTGPEASSWSSVR